MLFVLSLPNDFYIICISNLFSTICTKLDIYVAFFLCCLICVVLCYFIVYPTVVSEVRVPRSLVLCVCFGDRCLSFCTFFVWSLCCLSSFDIRILIIPLVSSSSSYCCLVQVIVVKMLYLFSLDILLYITTVKTINPFIQ